MCFRWRLRVDCTRLTDDSGSSPFPLVNNPRGSERRPNSPERHVKSRDFITGHSDTLAAVSTIWKSLTKIIWYKQVNLEIYLY